jgi:hypothetical protein
MWWFDVFCTKLDTEINMDMVAMVEFQREVGFIGVQLDFRRQRPNNVVTPIIGPSKNW